MGGRQKNPPGLWHKRCQDQSGTAGVAQASGVTKRLEETMPELDLEGEQVSHRKRSLLSEEDLPERGSSMCKGTEALNFPESHGFWWVVYEKLLRQAFPIAVQWPHRVCEN